MASIRSLAAGFCVVFLYFMVLCTDTSWATKPKNGRKISTMLNPDCNVEACKEGLNGSFSNIAYIKSEGSTDVLHYILTDIGPLSVLVIRGKPGSTVKFDWEKLLSDNSTERSNSSIWLEPEDSQLDNSYAVVFTRLYEYNDTDDEASLTYYDTRNTSWIIRSFGEDFGWQEVKSKKGDDDSAVFSIAYTRNETSGEFEDMNNKTMGTLSFTFKAFDSDGRSDILPKLEHNINNTIVDLLFNSFMPTFIQSRFAVEVVLIGTDKEKHVITETKSLDDEYTPGVFKMMDWTTNPKEKKHGGYLEWKPICYTASSRKRLTGTFVDYYSVTNAEEQKSFLEQSIVYSYFGENLFMGDFSQSATNISFGLTKDGFFTKTNYTVWTGSIGYGTPPEDVISILVIGVISAGLGLPVIIIIFGGVYVIVKKHMTSKDKEMVEH